jgi:hypothetical protein
VVEPIEAKTIDLPIVVAQPIEAPTIGDLPIAMEPIETPTIRLYRLICPLWWSPLRQWRNVISRGPRFKIFEGPPVEVPKARVERRICTRFLGGPGHAHPENV